MLQVKGVYKKRRIELFEELQLPPDTSVLITVWQENEREEAVYWQRLKETGLLMVTPQLNQMLPPFTPVPVTGEPVSQTILEERR